MDGYTRKTIQPYFNETKKKAFEKKKKRFFFLLFDLLKNRNKFFRVDKNPIKL